MQQTVQQLLSELESKRDELEEQIRTIRKATGVATGAAQSGRTPTYKQPVEVVDKRRNAWTPEKRREQSERIAKAIEAKKAKEAAERQRLEAAALSGRSEIRASGSGD